MSLNEAASTANSLVFAKNTIAPFHDHNCQDSLAEFGTAAGSGRFSDRTFRIQQCRICGLGLTDPVPTKETAHFLYESRESNDFQPDDSPLAAHLKAIAAQRDIRNLVRHLDIPAGPILDYGCGNGTFTLALQKAFPAVPVIGADMQEQAPKSLPQSNYRSYAELGDMSGGFALILCRHVLEHSYDPVSMLKNLSRLLVSGGILMVEVPSLETPVRLLFGRAWDGYYVPFHPIHFTRNSLNKAFVEAGLEVVREGKAEMPKMGRSLQNVFRSDYNTALFAAGVLLHPLQILIGAATRSSVCLRIWGRKP